MAAAKGNKYASKYTDKDIDDLCESLLKFAEAERFAHFAVWTRKHKKVPSWLYRMCEDYPKFAQAYEDAKELMAGKLVTSSIYQDDPNFNGTHAMAYQGIYNKDWKAFMKYKADIQKEQIKEAQNQCAFNDWKNQQKQNYCSQ